jgi:hypothetical protein
LTGDSAFSQRWVGCRHGHHAFGPTIRSVPVRMQG